MVNIVHRTNAISQVVEVVDSRKNIVLDNMFRNEFVRMGGNCLFQSVFPFGGLKDFLKDLETDFFVDAERLNIQVADIIMDIDHAV